MVYGTVWYGMALHGNAIYDIDKKYEYIIYSSMLWYMVSGDMVW